MNRYVSLYFFYLVEHILVCIPKISETVTPKTTLVWNRNEGAGGGGEFVPTLVWNCIWTGLIELWMSSDHRPVNKETVVQARILKHKKRQKTWEGGRVQISCSRPAQTKSVWDYRQWLSDSSCPGKLGRIPRRYAVLRTVVSLVLTRLTCVHHG